MDDDPVDGQTQLLTDDPRSRPPIGDHLRSLAEAAVSRDGILSCSVVIDSPQGSTAFAVSGHSVGNWTTQSRLPLYCGGKPVLAVVAAMLVERDLLSFEAPVCAWLPEYRTPGRDRITVAHLLLHTSGLPPAMWRPPDSGVLSVDLVSGAEPGKYPAYSRWLAWQVLGVVLERASGQDLEDLVQDLLVTPYGLPPLGFVQGAEVVPQCYSSNRQEWAPIAHPPSVPPLGYDAAFGLIGSAEALASFYRLVLTAVSTGRPDLARLLSLERSGLPDALLPGRPEFVGGFARSIGTFIGIPGVPRATLGSVALVLGHLCILGLADPENDIAVAILVVGAGRPSKVLVRRMVRSLYPRASSAPPSWHEPE